MTEFQCSTKIITGEFALERLRGIQAKNVLLVTDQYFSQSGKAMSVAGLIEQATIHLFDRVVPDPPAELAAEGAALCLSCSPEVMLAIGGGSVIDCAKGIRAAYDGELQFIAIPTTSGSGSEMTSYAILTKDGVKHPLVDDRLRPDLTILDERLLQQLPQSLIADTGMDLLAHCLEAVVATNRNGFTEALATYGVQTVLAALPASYQGDTSVRLRLHEAASMAGLAFDHTGLGLCHAMAHAMGGLLHIPHGRLCAILLPHVMEYNAGSALTQYARLARNCGLSGATDRLALRNLVSEFKRLQRVLHLPENLGQAGIDPAKWRLSVQNIVQAAMEDPCCKTNPAPVTAEVVERILKVVSP